LTSYYKNSISLERMTLASDDKVGSREVGKRWIVM